MEIQLEELIAKIHLIRGEDSSNEYLYRKDVYVDETAVTNVTSEKTENALDDFELPDISEEEIPEFLQGEEIDKI